MNSLGQAGVAICFDLHNTSFLFGRELQTLVAPKTPQGVLVRGHAGRVINKLSHQGELRDAVAERDALVATLQQRLAVAPYPLHPTPYTLYPTPYSCRAKSARIRQSRPDSGQIKVLKIYLKLFPLRSEAGSCKRHCLRNISKALALLQQTQSQDPQGLP